MPFESSEPQGHVPFFRPSHGALAAREGALHASCFCARPRVAAISAVGARVVISQCRYARADPAVATPALASVVQNRDRTAMCHSESRPLLCHISCSIPSVSRAAPAGERQQTLRYHDGHARSGVCGSGLGSAVRTHMLTVLCLKQ